MKILKPTLFIVAFSLFLAQQTHAQDAIAVNRNAVPISLESSDSKISASESNVIANPDARLTEKLLSVFPDAKAQEWRKLTNGYYVSFLNKSRKARAMFSEKGKMNYAITECSLEQLPEIFRSKIAKEYASYKVIGASEINAYDAIAHQAILENNQGYVTLKATSEGIEVIDTAKKDNK